MPICWLTLCCMIASQNHAEALSNAPAEHSAPMRSAAAPLVEVATPAQAQADETAIGVAYMLGVLQQTRVSVRFDSTPAKDAFPAIGAALDFPFIVHFRSAPGNPGSPGGRDAGIDPMQPIDLRANGVAALSVIEIMLDQCSAAEPCTWQFRNGMVEVGPKSVLNRPAAQEVRVYYIRDLLLEPPYFSSPGGGKPAQGPTGEVLAYVPQADPERDVDSLPGAVPVAKKTKRTGGVWRSVLGPHAGKDRKTQTEVAQTLMLHIADTIEPTAWDINGSTAATMTWRGDALIVRAPEYIHRRIAETPPPLTPAEIVQIRAQKEAD